MRRFRQLGPLAPIVAFFIGCLVIFSASRLGLTLAYLTRVRTVDGFAWLFPIGIRMDTSLLSIVLFVPALAILVLPERAGRWWHPLVAGYLASAGAFIVFMEAATVPFVAQYDSRPNRIFIDYLQYPHEVLSTVWAAYKTDIACAALLVIVAAWITWRTSLTLLRHHARWPYAVRLLVLPPFAALLFLGMRSSLGPRPANISTAAFSGDHLTNELALDSAYSVGYAIWCRRNEVDSAALYGELPRAEVIARVRRHTLLPEGAFFDPDIPLLHRQPSSRPRERPYNLVILLEESLGAEYVGTLGGLPLTPNLDALARDGLLLTNLYSTGTRTVLGIEATVAGYPPTASGSVVKLGLAQHGFFTVADLLRRRGYETEFIYGGRSNFDNMASFLIGNGFGRVVDEPSFEHPVLRGTWGVSDEDLVQRANTLFTAHGTRPFFALLLTTSNHPPFEYPGDRITLFEQPPNTVHNAIRYADFAIGELFRLARQRPYFANTLFLIVADHDTRVFGADLVPIEKFHIPGLILGPGVPVGRYDGLASQVDLLPTLLDLMGLDTEHPMIGRNLLQVAGDEPGHTFMQYDTTNAYRVGDRVVIHEPFKPPLEFTYRHGKLVRAPLDPEFARDALAHILLADMLYHEQRYRLPGESRSRQDAG